MIRNVQLLLILLFLSSCTKNNIILKKNGTAQQIDSLIKASRITSFSDSLRNYYLLKANEHIETLNNDSLKIKAYIRIAYSNLILGNIDNYGIICKKNLKISSMNSDSINVGRSLSDLGYYYQLKYKSDTAFHYYNKAFKIYKLLNNDLKCGKMLLSMATIQENEKDYSGSEIYTIKAILKLKNSSRFRDLYLAYNNLGTIYSNLGSYSLAIDNNKKAIESLKKVKNGLLFESTSLNNIGWIYNKQKKYSKAINFFDEALEIKDLFNSRPKTYAMILDNLAYSKFKLGQLGEIPELFYKSLKIRDSLQIKDGQVLSNQHLSEYFLTQSDTVTALKHARISKNIAKESNYNEGLLESYLLLSKLDPDKNGTVYLNKYIKLSDSLQQQERAIREKFTRIAYETDEIIIEKEEETKKKWQAILISGLGASFSILFFIYMRQRSRNKELEFTQEQDKANVEIYNLMLSQQKMFNEGSSKEKNRISKELHDGVLGRLFGTRLSLDAINESKTEEDIAEREKSIEELQLIEEDIRKISHNLKTSLFDNDTSFKMLVEQLVAKQSRISKFVYDLNFSNLLNWGNISNTIKINCYRILQESIQNINKYAKATNVKIDFIEEHGYLLFSIVDNGVGFNLKKTKKGIGIKNIRSRVEDLKGQVRFISKPQHGTKILVKIPIENELR